MFESRHSEKSSFPKLTFRSLNLKKKFKNSTFRLRCLVQYTQNVRFFCCILSLHAFVTPWMTSWTLQNEKIVLSRVPRVILNLWRLRLFTPTSKNDLFKTKYRSTATSKVQFFNLQFWTLKEHGLKNFGITLKNFHHLNRVCSKLIQKVHESKISLADYHSIDKLRKNFFSHQKLQASTLFTAQFIIELYIDR